MMLRLEKGTGVPFWKYASERHHPVPGAHGSSRKVVGSGTRIMSGYPVISGIPNPPPGWNSGTMIRFVVSMISTAVCMSCPLRRACRNALLVRVLPRRMPC
jgi:hypothetical protein